MSVIALLSSIIISMGSLAWGFSEAGFVLFARWLLIFGAAWLFAQWQGKEWFSSPGLFAALLASVFGLWLGVRPEWMFSGSIFALVAWDMSEFRLRLRSIAVDDNARGMERRHIARISLLSIAGLLFASIIVLIRVQFTFEWGVLLILVILLGLGQLVSWLKR